jgi:hypothetical protein
MRNETHDEDAISLGDDTDFAERIQRQERRSRKNIAILEGEPQVELTVASFFSARSHASAWTWALDWPVQAHTWSISG